MNFRYFTVIYFNWTGFRYTPRRLMRTETASREPCHPPLIQQVIAFSLFGYNSIKCRPLGAQELVSWWGSICGSSSPLMWRPKLNQTRIVSTNFLRVFHAHVLPRTGCPDLSLFGEWWIILLFNWLVRIQFNFVYYECVANRLRTPDDTIFESTEVVTVKCVLYRDDILAIFINQLSIFLQWEFLNHTRT